MSVTSGQSWTSTAVTTGSWEWTRPPRSQRASESRTDATKARTSLQRSRYDISASLKRILTLYNKWSERFLLTRYCHPTGGPGDSGVRFGSSDHPSAAGWVLLQWFSQKLVISVAAESRHDAGGENWSFTLEPELTLTYRKLSGKHTDLWTEGFIQIWSLKVRRYSSLNIQHSLKLFQNRLYTLSKTNQTPRARAELIQKHVQPCS